MTMDTNHDQTLLDEDEPEIEEKKMREFERRMKMT